MKILKMIYCFLFRHDLLLVYEEDNGRSQFKQYKCVRCDKEFDFQYDYDRWG